MATPGDSDPQSPAQGPELSKPVDADRQVVEDSAANDTSERPFFAPSEPMREEQVQNAVKFLAHPKVRGSPVVYRRSFLEKKGLTKDEIDEAFRRVPDPPSNVTSVEAATSNQVAQPKPSTSLQPQVPVQSPLPPGAVNSVSVVPSVHQSRFHWSHALIAAGVLAASGAGSAVFFKNVVVPRLKTWIRKVVEEEKESEKEGEQASVLAEQTAEAAKAAATAAAMVAKASEELLNSKNEERKYFEAFMSMMDVQVKEMKSIGETIRKLESAREASRSQDKMIEDYIQSNMGTGTTNNSWGIPQANQPNTSLSYVSRNQVKMNGTSSPGYGEVRPSSAPATVVPTTVLHPKSYMETMAMSQSGEGHVNIREINAMPHNPYQQPTNFSAASTPKEINAMPPNPYQPPTNFSVASTPKPWEVPQQKPTYSEVLSFGNEENGTSTDPFWKKKAVKITEVEPEAEEARQRRGWVPPQPPGVAIPESAVAIRQPKSSIQKQQSGEIARSDDGGNGVAAVSDMRVEPDASSSVFNESNRSEIEEDNESNIEIK